MRDPPGEGQVGFIRVILAAMWTSDGKEGEGGGESGEASIAGASRSGG